MTSRVKGRIATKGGRERFEAPKGYATKNRAMKAAREAAAWEAKRTPHQEAISAAMKRHWKKRKRAASKTKGKT